MTAAVTAPCGGCCVGLTPGALAHPINEDLKAINAGVISRPAGILQSQVVELTSCRLELFVDRWGVFVVVLRVIIELNELLT